MRTVYVPIFTLRPYERGIQETLGKYSRFVMPGLGVQIPLVHITRVRDIREHTMDIEPQPVITKDNVEITVDGVMWQRVRSKLLNNKNWRSSSVLRASARQSFRSHRAKRKPSAWSTRLPRSISSATPRSLRIWR